MAETVRLDIQGMLERFKFLGNKLAPTVYSAMVVSAERIVRDVKLNRMSGPKGAPGTLGVVTGHGRDSITDLIRLTGDTINAVIGSELPAARYVDVHEHGYKGPQSVRAHMRRRLGKIRAVSIAAATHGQVSRRGSPSAAQKAAGPIHVRAFTRKVNIAAKHMVRDTILLSIQPTMNRIERALVMAARTGNVPKPGDIGA